MELKSTAFRAGEPIPVHYTCDGAGVSPPLSWNGVPLGTLSLAIVLHDPDAPRRGGFTHWLVYNMEPHSSSLPEAIPPRERLGISAMQGVNDAGRIDYFGPCPPTGTHRYVFTLYALKSMLDLDPGASPRTFFAAAKNHILATAALMGTYCRK